MPLLQWCTLRPQGPSNLAAIRFSAPIHITSLKVFPNGTRPFKEAPDVVAETQPEAFFLDIYFNAQPLHSNIDKEKQRAPNALIPTSIAYAGGQMEFAFDMGTEYATRLMIVKGNFDVLSLAIYGNVVSTDREVDSAYDSKPLSIPPEPYPLSATLDVANHSESRKLAEQLLTLMAVNPPLPLIIRLMFCLKPSEDDWDDSEFPYLYADLDDKDSDFDLEGVIGSLGRPVRDDLTKDEFTTLVDRVNDFLGPKDNDQAYYLAKLLSIAAPQHPEMARSLLENIDVEDYFDPTTLADESTLLCILDACANRDIANHLSNKPAFLEALGQLLGDRQTDEYVRSACRKVDKVVGSWRIMEDAFTNDDANFQEAIDFILEVTSEENTTGIFLSCILANDDLVAKLNKVKSDVSRLPPRLSREAPPTSSAEFVALVRTVVGVLCVLSAWAWADSLGIDECRERILAVLDIWQDIDGYREILNHLLHLRQLTRRLGWVIADSNPPRKSGIFAERLLMRLAEDPSAILHEELYKAILDLKSPLSTITEDERKAMVKIALVAEDGLPAALEELLFVSDRPLSLRRLRALRVSMAIISKELDENDDDEDKTMKILQSLWQVDSHGFVPRLIELLKDVTEDISQHFGGDEEMESNSKLLSQLFETASDVLRLIQRTTDGYPLTSRYLRTLTTSITDLSTCSNISQNVYSATSLVAKSTTSSIREGVTTLQGLVGEDMKTEAGTLNALVVLRTLLNHGTHTDLVFDPIIHIRQVAATIDQLLPPASFKADDAMYEDDQPPPYWVSLVIPKVLHELKGFFSLLDSEIKISLFNRLCALDQGLVGLGEWLLGEELKVLHQIIQDLRSAQELHSRNYQMLLEEQVVEGIEFLWRVLEVQSADAPSWLDEALQSDGTVSLLLEQVLTALLDARIVTPPLGSLTQALAKRKESLPTFKLRYAIALHLIRAAQVDPASFALLDDALPILQQIPPTAFPSDTLLLELGLALTSLTKQESTLESHQCSSLFKLFEWLSRGESKKLGALRGITTTRLSSLAESLSKALPEKETAISNARNNITIDEDETFALPIDELKHKPIIISLGSIPELFTPTEKEVDQSEGRPATPTKRTGYKTPDILGTVISPPTALLRSPAATGLTKTYNANDFRQLRQVPSARLNTSRLPSMHVDDFETSGSSPTALMASPEIAMGGVGAPVTALGVTIGAGGAIPMAGIPGMGVPMAGVAQQQQQHQSYGGVPGLGMLGSPGMPSMGLGM